MARVTEKRHELEHLFFPRWNSAHETLCSTLIFSTQCEGGMKISEMCHLPGVRICSHALAVPTGVAHVTGENMARFLTEERCN